MINGDHALSIFLDINGVFNNPPFHAITLITNAHQSTASRNLTQPNKHFHKEIALYQAENHWIND